MWFVGVAAQTVRCCVGCVVCYGLDGTRCRRFRAFASDGPLSVQLAWRPPMRPGSTASRRLASTHSVACRQQQPRARRRRARPAARTPGRSATSAKRLGDNSMAMGLQSAATATIAQRDRRSQPGHRRQQRRLRHAERGAGAQQRPRSAISARRPARTATAVGILERQRAPNTTAVGNQSHASGGNSAAIGVLSSASATDAAAFGNQSIATARITRGLRRAQQGDR